MRLIALLILVLALSGCVNGYQQFYRPVPGATPETIAKIRAAPPSGNILVDRVPAFDKAVLDNYVKNGYTLIGYSLFNTGQKQSDDFAITQGKSVQADLVVIANPKYTGTETRVVPYFYQTPVASTTINVNVNNGGHSPNFFNPNINIPVNETKVANMPVYIDHVDYGAAYFVKTYSIFGAIGRNLNDSERQSLQTNKGVVITLVVNDSPAFNADILLGDIVESMNGQAVTSAQELRSALEANAGRTVVLSIIREQKHLEKSVQLRPRPAAVQGTNAAAPRK
jgi:hypothetical protein